MKNKDIYINDIAKALARCDTVFCPSMISNTYTCHIRKEDYDAKDCERCILDWLDAEYISAVDWSKVEIDTPVIVWDGKSPDWLFRHFAEIDDDGNVVTWGSGRTSWTKNGELESWEIAKLAESED